MKNNRETGSRYEEKAAAYLKKQGYTILEQNYRCPTGEIDLIARKEGLIVFAEVKYRKNMAFGNPLEAVDEKKRRKLYRTAQHYCTFHPEAAGGPCRFDVIGILGEKLIHIEDAFGGM